MIRSSMFVGSGRFTEGAAAAIVNDYWWPAGLPTNPAAIPLCWLRQRVGMRLDRPFNHAEVTQSGGVSARRDNLTSIATTKGAYPFTATLATAVDADTANLAHFMVTYFGDPRMRLPSLTIDLLYRSDDEKRLLLRLGIGAHVQITGVPAYWPAGADHLVIAGISHDLSVRSRLLRLTCAPLVGAVAGTAGPWWRWGTSVWDGPDSRTF